jgi:hypothetical protein
VNILPTVRRVGRIKRQTESDTQLNSGQQALTQLVDGTVTSIYFHITRGEIEISNTSTIILVDTSHEYV